MKKSAKRVDNAVSKINVNTSHRSTQFIKSINDDGQWTTEKSTSYSIKSAINLQMT